MRLKKPLKNKTQRIEIKVTEEEKNKIKLKANLYCEGNVSEYLIYTALNFVADKEDFEEEKEKPKKRGAR